MGPKVRRKTEDQAPESRAPSDRLIGDPHTTPDKETWRTGQLAYNLNPAPAAAARTIATISMVPFELVV
jgi:hypothetical protein